ncbi:unnamed protein product [Ambrosiozyma monospora]|uniref:Unnamed protein product n=1 Tax=Ambrosiozyma monospora TaxID=43982 RepID=A0ACB5UBW5_AMBMO|nr:unnamed protein product [Ambrosiozyma monospora]
MKINALSLERLEIDHLKPVTCLPIHLKKLKSLKKLAIKNYKKAKAPLITSIPDTVVNLCLLEPKYLTMTDDHSHKSKPINKLPSQLRELTIQDPCSGTISDIDLSRLPHLKHLRPLEYSSMKLFAYHLTHVPPNLETLALSVRDVNVNFDQLRLDRFRQFYGLSLSSHFRRTQGTTCFTTLPPSLTYL